MRSQFILLAYLVFFCGCKSSQQLIHAQTTKLPQLKFLGEYDVPHGKEFEKTVIGGLSGIDYDSKSGLYFLISDDRSTINAARFYTARISVKERGIDSVEFVEVHTLLQKNGIAYPNSKMDPLHTPDPEDMRYDPLKEQLVWSSEGERLLRPGVQVLVDPSLTVTDRKGQFTDSFTIPSNMHMSAAESGPRQNSGFEGLCFSGDYKYLFVNLEEPIYEDGPRAGLADSAAWVRIIKFDTETKKAITQYAYPIEPVAHAAVPEGAFRINGLSAILWAGENKLITVERSFSTGMLACTIRVFLSDLGKATDVSGVHALNPANNVNAVSKNLLINMDSLGRYIDNIEGVTWGPDLPNGNRTLIFISDNNFSPLEKTQFLLFEWVSPE